jgi:hypothetical protein
MKKIFIRFLFIVFLSINFSFININSSKTEAKELAIEFVECKHGQCEATAKSTKKRCKHCVSDEGDKYCWQHK